MLISKIGFKITSDNVDFLVGGVKSSYEDTDKRRILKNLFFEKTVSKQTEEKLKKVWW